MNFGMSLAVSKETFYFLDVVSACNAIRFQIDLETIKRCIAFVLLRFFSFISLSLPYRSIISCFVQFFICEIVPNLHLINFNCFAIVFIFRDVLMGSRKPQPNIIWWVEHIKPNRESTTSYTLISNCFFEMWDKATPENGTSQNTHTLTISDES